MLRHIIATALLIAASATMSHSAATERRSRLRDYRHNLYGKSTIGGAAANAGVHQLRNSPHEWGGGAGGFAKRFGSALGQHAVRATIEFGVSAWHHEDLHYHRSHLHGTLPRMKYALVSTFVVPRTNKPGKTVALGRISGGMGAGLISRLWQPASTAGIGAGIASGGASLGATVGVNMAREFWPHKHSHKRKLSSRAHTRA